MCDHAKIERELSHLVREIGDISNFGTWARVIAKNLQQMGTTCLAELTVAQLLEVITDAEQAMSELDVHGETLEVQHAS